MADDKPSRWVIWNPNTREEKFFDSETTAESCLDSPFPLPTEKQEAKHLMRGERAALAAKLKDDEKLSRKKRVALCKKLKKKQNEVEQGLVARRKDLNSERQQTDSLFERKRLNYGAYPPRLTKLSYRQKGWEGPAPMKWLQDYPKAESSAPTPPLEIPVEAIRKRIETEDFDVETEIFHAGLTEKRETSYYLPWLSKNIEANAYKKTGVDYDGRYDEQPIESIAQLIADSARDWVDSFNTEYPCSSHELQKDFRRSPQIRMWGTAFGERCGHGETAIRLAGSPEEALKQARGAVVYVLRALADFTQAHPASATTESVGCQKSLPGGKRGRKSKFNALQLTQAFEAKNKNAGKKGNQEAAKILYRTETPTPQQRRSVPTILKHHGLRSAKK